jgi:hypothetical protein
MKDKPRLRTPKRVVEYDGDEYKVRRQDIEVPDLMAMDRLDVLIWLNRNTYGKGRSNVKPNPLAGLGEALNLGIR